MSNPESSADEVKWVNNYHVVLTSQDDRAILMQPQGDAWTLPCVRLEDGLWIGDTDKIMAAIHARIGLTLNVTILRYLSLIVNEEEKWDQVIWLLECHEAIPESPLNGRWISRNELATVPLASAEHRPLLLDHLEELAARAIPPQRPPWALTGWHSKTVAWIEDSLTELGYAQSGPC